MSAKAYPLARIGNLARKLGVSFGQAASLCGRKGARRRAELIGWQPKPETRVVRKRRASVPWAQATRVAETFLENPGRWESQAACAAEHRMAVQTLNSAIWRLRSRLGRPPRHDKRRAVA